MNTVNRRLMHGDVQTCACSTPHDGAARAEDEPSGVAAPDPVMLQYTRRASAADVPIYVCVCVC